MWKELQVSKEKMSTFMDGPIVTNVKTERIEYSVHWVPDCLSQEDENGMTDMHNYLPICQIEPMMRVYDRLAYSEVLS